jgi:hypothetical protein
MCQYVNFNSCQCLPLRTEVPYEITFFTGDVADAGTDSQVFIKVFGVKGSSSDIVIPKMSERFERSRVDLIKVSVSSQLIKYLLSVH